MLQICAFSIITVVLYVFVKEHKPEYAVLVSLCGVVVVLLFLLPEIKKIIDFAEGFFETSAVGGGYFILLLKALGITVITQFSADTCRDAGQSALASKVEFTGRALILVMTLPMVRSVAQIVVGII